MLSISQRFQAALSWLSDETHRRALTGVLTGALGFALHYEVDSAFVDAALLILIPALLSAWKPTRE